MLIISYTIEIFKRIRNKFLNFIFAMDELENVKTELVLTALSCSNLSSLTLSKKVCSIVTAEQSYQRIG